MVGKWTGKLGYRDYKTNQLFELDMKTETRAVPDGVTFIRTSSFDDGPKVGLVWITSVSLYDPVKNRVTTATVRKGRPIEAETETVTMLKFTNPQHWSVRYEHDGTDDDKPATLRTTETRDGDKLLSVKEVMPASEMAKGWQFRNQTRLTRDAIR